MLTSQGFTANDMKNNADILTSALNILAPRPAAETQVATDSTLSFVPRFLDWLIPRASDSSRSKFRSQRHSRSRSTPLPLRPLGLSPRASPPRPPALAYALIAFYDQRDLPHRFGLESRTDRRAQAAPTDAPIPLPAGDRQLTLEELVNTKDDPEKIYTDMKKIGEGYANHTCLAAAAAAALFVPSFLRRAFRVTSFLVLVTLTLRAELLARCSRRSRRRGRRWP
jgi:hypothetical protein